MAVETLPHHTTTSASTIDVRPLSVHIGAEIAGVNLTQPLTPEAVQDIRTALLRWKVVFFRGQELDHQQHIAFARQFGELTPGHVVFGSDDTYPEIYSVAKHRKANRHQGQALVRPWSGWHADITAAINPPAASVLRGVVVPPYGGDTQWTNLVTAYNSLSPTLRGFLGWATRYTSFCSAARGTEDRRIRRPGTPPDARQPTSPGQGTPGDGRARAVCQSLVSKVYRWPDASGKPAVA